MNEHPVSQERWRKFFQDGDDTIVHRTQPMTGLKRPGPCGGRLRIRKADPSLGAVGTEAHCPSCGIIMWEFQLPQIALIDGTDTKTFYAITPEREPRYKLTEVVSGKTRYTTLVLLP